MQSSTGQYSTHAGEPAHPVQHSVITASSFGFFLRGVASPFDLGSNLSSSGTIPIALLAPGAAGMRGIIAQKRQAAESNPPIIRYISCKEHHRGFGPSLRPQRPFPAASAVKKPL